MKTLRKIYQHSFADHFTDVGKMVDPGSGSQMVVMG